MEWSQNEMKCEQVQLQLDRLYSQVVQVKKGGVQRFDLG
jgi:hypothetical protein